MAVPVGHIQVYPEPLDDTPSNAIQEKGQRVLLGRTQSAASLNDPGPPPDGGVRAWSQVLAGHLIIMTTWCVSSNIPITIHGCGNPAILANVGLGATSTRLVSMRLTMSTSSIALTPMWHGSEACRSSWSSSLVHSQAGLPMRDTFVQSSVSNNVFGPHPPSGPKTDRSLPRCSSRDSIDSTRHIHGLPIHTVLAVIPSPGGLRRSRRWMSVLSGIGNSIHIFLQEENAGHWHLRVRQRHRRISLPGHVPTIDPKAWLWMDHEGRGFHHHGLLDHL